jgi:hypothetical protein
MLGRSMSSSPSHRFLANLKSILPSLLVKAIV